MTNSLLDGEAGIKLLSRSLGHHCWTVLYISEEDNLVEVNS